MVLIAESGRLAETPLPRLLLDLHRSRFSGGLVLRRERVEKQLQFREGIPVFADSNLRAESLASQLLKSGTIGESDYARVVQRVEREGCKEGNAVLEMDLAPAREVFEALKEQVRRRLLECFGWEDGTFQVVPGDAPPDALQAFRADFHRLLQEGIESRWSSDRILKSLAPHMQRFVAIEPSARARMRRLPSDASLDAVLEAADGSRSLWQLVPLATTPRALASIWLLDAIDGLEYGDEPRTGGAVESEPEVEIVFERPTEDAGARRAGAQAGAPRDESTRTDADPKNARLFDDITSKFSQLGKIDYYALLGVASNADATAIRRAYLAAAKEYHPDTLARSGFDAEVRAQASRVFASIGKAYATLSRADARREYDSRLSGDNLGANAEQIATAETLYRKGEILLRQGNFRGALEFLLPAVEIYPEEADYQNAAGWALYRQSPPKPAAARTHLRKATELAPNDAVVHFRLSVVLRHLGESDEAEAALRRAREIDPNVG